MMDDPVLILPNIKDDSNPFLFEMIRSSDAGGTRSVLFEANDEAAIIFPLPVRSAGKDGMNSRAELTQK